AALWGVGARRRRDGPRRHVDGWALQDTAGLLAGGQERSNFALQRVVVHAGLAQERVALVGRTRQRRFQQAIDLPRSFSVHRESRLPTRDRGGNMALDQRGLEARMSWTTVPPCGP